MKELLIKCQKILSELINEVDFIPPELFKETSLLLIEVTNKILELSDIELNQTGEQS